MISRELNHTSQSKPADFFSAHPAIVALFSFIIFWLYRSQTYVGDGDQLARIIEANYWFVQTELASQFLLQLTYQLLQPLGFNGLMVQNLLSSISGALTVWVILLFNRDYVGINGIWSLALLCSSGLLILCFGHTEYYTMFMASLFFYAYIAVGYLRGNYSSLQTALAFSLSVWIHLGILFAFPAFIILPLLKKNYADYKGLLIGSIPIVLAFLFKKNSEIIGIDVHGLSPSVNFVPLFEITSTQFYTLFQWGHLLDILWAWGMRSWLFWPIILVALCTYGFRSLLLNERLFLFLYATCFLIFTWIWHPNLGIESDWDLFSIAAIPSLLLTLSYLPQLITSMPNKILLTLPLIASTLITLTFIHDRAQIDQRGLGSLLISPSEEIDTHVTINGHQKGLFVPSLNQGKHTVKVIDKTHHNVYNFYLYIAPNIQTNVPLEIINQINDPTK